MNGYLMIIDRIKGKNINHAAFLVMKEQFTKMSQV